MHSLVCSVAVLSVLVAAPARPGESLRLETGYRLMYGLDFTGADRHFATWQQENAGDALGPVSRAANVLFQEFDRLGILQSQFFQDDSAFTSSKKPAPSPDAARQFNALLTRGEALAQDRLARAPRDLDALFGLTLVYGLRADYAALIEGRNLASLSYTRQASAHAKTLLAIAPDYYDAYLATGINQYILGSLPAPVRWLFRVAGYSGDKRKGMEELTLAADHGQLLGPFARILLAVGYLREGDKTRARALLDGLRHDFPSNPLFARELERLGAPLP
jgi:hypothetical protein